MTSVLIRIPSPRVTARMRLQAGVSLLRLACKKEYAEQVLQTENFVTLALVAQDEQHQIRQRFIAALLKLLAARQLRNWFHAMIFITAHDPEPEIPNMVKSYIQSVSRAANNSMCLINCPLS
jgi:sister-chromatid-cohesion protein PDS5